MAKRKFNDLEEDFDALSSRELEEALNANETIKNNSLAIERKFKNILFRKERTTNINFLASLPTSNQFLYPIQWVAISKNETTGYDSLSEGIYLIGKEEVGERTARCLVSQEPGLFVAAQKNPSTLLFLKTVHPTETLKSNERFETFNYKYEIQPSSITVIQDIFKTDASTKPWYLCKIRTSSWQETFTLYRSMTDAYNTGKIIPDSRYFFAPFEWSVKTFIIWTLYVKYQRIINPHMHMFNRHLRYKLPPPNMPYFKCLYWDIETVAYSSDRVPLGENPQDRFVSCSIVDNENHCITLIVLPANFKCTEAEMQAVMTGPEEEEIIRYEHEHTAIQALVSILANQDQFTLIIGYNSQDYDANFIRKRLIYYNDYETLKLLTVINGSVCFGLRTASYDYMVHISKAGESYPNYKLKTVAQAKLGTTKEDVNAVLIRFVYIEMAEHPDKTFYIDSKFNCVWKDSKTGATIRQTLTISDILKYNKTDVTLLRDIFTGIENNLFHVRMGAENKLLTALEYNTFTTKNFESPSFQFTSATLKSRDKQLTFFMTQTPSMQLVAGQFGVFDLCENVVRSGGFNYCPEIPKIARLTIESDFNAMYPCAMIEKSIDPATVIYVSMDQLLSLVPELYARLDEYELFYTPLHKDYIWPAKSVKSRDGLPDTLKASSKVRAVQYVTGILINGGPIGLGDLYHLPQNAIIAIRSKGKDGAVARVQEEYTISRNKKKELEAHLRGVKRQVDARLAEMAAEANGAPLPPLSTEYIAQIHAKYAPIHFTEAKDDPYQTEQYFQIKYPSPPFVGTSREELTILSQSLKERCSSASCMQNLQKLTNNSTYGYIKYASSIVPAFTTAVSRAWIIRVCQWISLYRRPHHPRLSIIYCDTDSVQVLINGFDCESYNEKRGTIDAYFKLIAEQLLNESKGQQEFKQELKFDYITLGKKIYCYKTETGAISTRGIPVNMIPAVQFIIKFTLNVVFNNELFHTVIINQNLRKIGLFFFFTELYKYLAYEIHKNLNDNTQSRKIAEFQRVSTLDDQHMKRTKAEAAIKAPEYEFKDKERCYFRAEPYTKARTQAELSAHTICRLNPRHPQPQPTRYAMFKEESEKHQALCDIESYTVDDINLYFIVSYVRDKVHKMINAIVTDEYRRETGHPMLISNRELIEAEIMAYSLLYCNVQRTLTNYQPHTEKNSLIKVFLPRRLAYYRLILNLQILTTDLETLNKPVVATTSGATCKGKGSKK